MTFQARKRLVLDRDKKCLECGNTKDLTVDHIIPLSRGGMNTLDNLRTLCGQCNRRKSSMIKWEWWERLQMAFHVDAIVERLKNEMKGLVASTFGNVSAQIRSSIQLEANKLRDEIKDKDHVIDSQAEAIALQHERIKTLEAYLKIEYVRETKTVNVREYRKVKK